VGVHQPPGKKLPVPIFYSPDAGARISQLKSEGHKFTEDTGDNGTLTSPDGQQLFLFVE
jgi:hypothetical protein